MYKKIIFLLCAGLMTGRLVLGMDDFFVGDVKDLIRTSILVGNENVIVCGGKI